ncbi:ABC transporter permease [Microbacterium esteraromaticum]|uniref:ABC transporter permease n=2 Tax=Microbacterium esteraromaticum TaxID=57043 RepID=A0A7D7WJE0_9MICO|nr:ABC transporter permease [Microbacterium esteraromaticum]
MSETPGVVDGETSTRSSTYLRYVANKLVGVAISLILVVLMSFFAFRILPGDPVASLTRGRPVLGPQLAQLKKEFGLDQPLWTQFVIYLEHLFQGDLGESYTYRAPVSDLIMDYLFPTLLLTTVSAAIAITLGLWVGQRAAWRRGSWFDNLSTGTALVFWSMPTFWFGLILLLIFAGMLHILPAGGMVTPGANLTGFPYLWDLIRHLALPVATMVAVSYAQYSLIMRASLIEEMSSDYLTTARAKGLTDDAVRRRHAVPNALLPTVTIVFLQIGGLIAGAVTVETVFSWPGLGFLTFQALSGPDLPLLQGTFVVFSSIIILTNFAADLVYRAIDPRVTTA